MSRRSQNLDLDKHATYLVAGGFGDIGRSEVDGLKAPSIRRSRHDQHRRLLKPLAN